MAAASPLSPGGAGVAAAGGAGAPGGDATAAAAERQIAKARRGSSMLTVLTNSTAKLSAAAYRARMAVAEKSKADDEARAEERRRRAEFALMASTTEKWIWLKDEREGYVAAKVLKENPDGSADVEFGTSRTIKTAKKAELGPFIVRMAELKNHVDGAWSRPADAGMGWPGANRDHPPGGH